MLQYIYTYMHTLQSSAVTVRKVATIIGTVTSVRTISCTILSQESYTISRPQKPMPNDLMFVWSANHLHPCVERQNTSMLVLSANQKKINTRPGGREISALDFSARRDPLPAPRGIRPAAQLREQRLYGES